MESRHRCRLCFKKFANGRALGGHMRSHMMNPPSTATPFKPPPPPPTPHDEDVDLHHVTELPESETSTSSPSSEEETEYDDDDDNTGKGLTSYELPRREDPNQRGGVSRLADPEPSLLRLPTEAAGSSSGIIMLQDRESETESSKKPTRRRSKRNRRSFLISDIDRSNTRCYYVNDNHHHHHNNNPNKVQENSNEGEPVSSISEVSPEEDVAFCLMMLSQDQWNRGNQMKKKRKMKKIYDHDGGGHTDADIKNKVGIDDDSDDGDQEEEEEEVKLSESTQVSDHEEAVPFTKSKNKNNNNNNSNSRGKYKCETCSKVFRSYQALGGHRASHKKFRISVAVGPTPENKKGCDGEDDESKRGSHHPHHGGEEEEEEKKKKIHECPVCLRVFASGQALGGHKRSHVIIDRGERRKVAELEESKEDIVKSGKWIDLNLPAPTDDDYEISQIAVSAVSDSVNL